MDPRLSETEVIVRAPRVEIPRIEFLGCRPGRWLRDEVRDFQWQGKAGLCVEYAGVRTRCCYLVCARNRIGGVCIHGCVSPPNPCRSLTTTASYSWHGMSGSEPLQRTLGSMWLDRAMCSTRSSSPSSRVQAAASTTTERCAVGHER